MELEMFKNTKADWWQEKIFKYLELIILKHSLLWWSGHLLLIGNEELDI